MPTSKVYFTDLRTQIGVSQLDKLEKLIRAAGIGDIDFDHKMTAIKIHFGEPGNLTYLRPNYAKRVADVIKSLGGLPFLTDCNTLYPGRRKNALEHIESAYENGFTPYSTGCQVIIADGLKGSDDIEVPVQGGEYVKTAKIGRAIMDADIFISLSHFKGHEMTGFGGTIKNIGMGCGSRRGKMEQHAAGKPTVSAKRCVGCRQCAKQCAQDAISYGEDRKASIDHSKCVGCGRCIASCNFDAISAENDVNHYRSTENRSDSVDRYYAAIAGQYTKQIAGQGNNTACHHSDRHQQPVTVCGQHQPDNVRNCQTNKRHRTAKRCDHCREQPCDNKQQVAHPDDPDTETPSVSVSKRHEVKWLDKTQRTGQTEDYNGGEQWHLPHGHTTEITHSPDNVRLHPLFRRKEIEKRYGR